MKDISLPAAHERTDVFASYKKFRRRFPGFVFLFFLESAFVFPLLSKPWLAALGRARRGEKHEGDITSPIAAEISWMRSAHLGWGPLVHPTGIEERALNMGSPKPFLSLFFLFSSTGGA